MNNLQTEISEIISEITKVDKTNIMSHRIEELATIIYLAKPYSKVFDNLELFEAGNAPINDIDNGLNSNNISFFFNNHPSFAKYKAYSPHYPAVHSSIDLKEIADYNAIKYKKMHLTFEEITNNFLHQQIEKYEDFEKNVKNSKDPIIFSTYVLGCPSLEKEDFWKLPGNHIHFTLSGDLCHEHAEKYPQIHLNPRDDYKNKCKQMVVDVFEVPNPEIHILDRHRIVMQYTVNE